MGLTGIQLEQALSVLDINTTGNSDAFDRLATNFQEINNWQKSGYEDSWARVLRKFQDVHRRFSNISEILDVMDAPPDTNGLVNTTLDNSTHPLRIDKAGFTPRPDHIVVVRDGKYIQLARENAREKYLVNTMLGAVTPATEAIVELGCGWGRNLAALATALGRDDVMFVGAEQSEAGRTCTKALMELDGRFQHEVVSFDFYEPDLSFLDSYNEVVIFTCAAIEQIAFLHADFVQSLLRSADSVKLVFLEPFAWQANEALAQPVLSKCLMNVRDQTSFTSILKDYEFRLSDDCLNRNSSVWALSCCYNMNLYSQLTAVGKSGSAEIEQLAFNVDGNNLFNPYSLAVLSTSDKA